MGGVAEEEKRNICNNIRKTDVEGVELQAQHAQFSQVEKMEPSLSSSAGLTLIQTEQNSKAGDVRVQCPFPDLLLCFHY